jgi:hypothetical protein
MKYIISPLLACGEGVGVLVFHSAKNCYIYIRFDAKYP